MVCSFNGIPCWFLPTWHSFPVPRNSFKRANVPHGQQLWYKYVLWKISTHTENLTVCVRKQVASMQKIGVVAAFKASSSTGSRSIYLHPATALTALKALPCVISWNLICRNLGAQNLFCLNLLQWTCILHRNHSFAHQRTYDLRNHHLPKPKTVCLQAVANRWETITTLADHMWTYTLLFAAMKHEEWKLQGKKL